VHSSGRPRRAQLGQASRNAAKHGVDAGYVEDGEFALFEGITETPARVQCGAQVALDGPAVAG
jgi:hypothetical protein